MLLLLLAIVSFVVADPCSSIQAYVPTPYATALACLRSIPFNSTLRDVTIDNLSKAMQLYTFLDIATNPPDQQHFIKVDLLKQLAALKTQTFPSDLDMHMAIAGVFRELSDAHTRYRPTACYLKFNFYTGLPLYGYASSPFTAPILAVVDPEGVAAGLDPRDRGFESLKRVARQISILNRAIDVLMTMNKQLGPLWQKQVTEATVMNVNGKSGWDYVMAFANSSVGISKSMETRLNLGLTKFYERKTELGMFTKRNVNWNPIPPTPSINYTLASAANPGVPFTFVADWYMISPYDILSTAELINDCYGDTPLQSTRDAPAMPAHVKALEEQVFNSPNRLPKVGTERSRSVHAPSGFRIVLAGSGVAFWLGTNVQQQTVLTMFIPSFSIPDDDSAFARDVARGLAIGAANNATKLIIDLSGNGGGNICVGLALLEYTNLGLNPSPNSGGQVFSDMPSSEVARAMAMSYANSTDSAWSAGAYASDATGKPFTNESWLIPGVPHVRGGLARNYSELLFLSEASCGSARFGFNATHGFAPQDIVIVTKGECGSTCALFSNHASKYAHVKTAVVGMHDPSNQQYSSFPGLQVLEDSEILRELQSANITGPLVPQTFRGGTYRACIREIYGPVNHDQPLEYTWQPADQSIILDQYSAKIFGSYWAML